MEESWILHTKKADFFGIGEKLGIDPVLVRIMRNRDILTEEEMERFINAKDFFLSSYSLLPDMDKALEIIAPYRNSGRKIRIIGDYDIDGVCASFILCKGLSYLGFTPDNVIPHRITDGYGLNERLIDEAANDGIELIVTCDNGISAVSQIEHSNSLGIPVIVTDHHEVPFEETPSGKKYIIPDAAAVIDPKREGSLYPFCEICGAVVAFQFVRALFAYFGEKDDALMDEFTGVSAFATIGDVMELKGENRSLVKRGLPLLMKGVNVGIERLINACGLTGKELSVYHVGFVLGPCLNATGRLDTAQRALALLKEEEPGKAGEIALELQKINEERKTMTSDGVKMAEELLLDWDLDKKPVIALFLPEVHESLAGIIAGRIKEKTNHPTFILTRCEEGLKGSGRSIESYDMYENMCRIKEVFVKFGGHKMAAGLSIREEDFDSFVNKLNENCTLSKPDFLRKIYIDLEMPTSYVTKDFVTHLSLLEPFGTGNPKPVFAERNITFVSVKVVGSKNNCIKILGRDEKGTEKEFVLFSPHETFDEYVSSRVGETGLRNMYLGRGNGVFSVLFYPQINEFRGKEKIQFNLIGYK